MSSDTKSIDNDPCEADTLFLTQRQSLALEFLFFAGYNHTSSLKILIAGGKINFETPFPTNRLWMSRLSLSLSLSFRVSFSHLILFVEHSFVEH